MEPQRKYKKYFLDIAILISFFFFNLKTLISVLMITRLILPCEKSLFGGTESIKT